MVQRGVGAGVEGIFVYKLVTFIETSVTCFGSFIFSMKSMKSVVSLRYDFC